MTSTEALEVEDVPENLLIVGGGYIGMELGTVYAALGSKIVSGRGARQLLTGADPDLARSSWRMRRRRSKKSGSRRTSPKWPRGQTNQSRDGI